MRDNNGLASSSFSQNSGVPSAAYQDLTRIFTRLQKLGDEYNELQPRKWLLPEGPELDEVVRRMKELRHQQITILADPANRVEEHLKTCEKYESALNTRQRGDVFHWQRFYNQFSGFIKDPALIAESEEVTADAEPQWLATLEQAETNGRAAAFAAQIPILERVFDLRRRTAAEPARRLGCKISEACLDQLSPGMRNGDVDAIYGKLRGVYPSLVAATLAEDARTPKPLPLPVIPAEKQLRVFERIRAAMLEASGYSDEQLKADGIDVKMSTAQTGFVWGSTKEYHLAIETYEDNLAKGLSTCVHEVGHLMFLLHRGRQQQMTGQYDAFSTGFDAHESVAMFFEQVALRRRFFDFIAPVIKEELGVNGPEWEPENLYRLANRPRLDNLEWCASELALTPNMAWRALAERKILDGEMEVRDLPQFWADTMHEYTGLDYDPQDFLVEESHWFEGLQGYFASYQMGGMAATEYITEIARSHGAPDGAATDLSSYFRPYYEEVRDTLFSAMGQPIPGGLIPAALGRRPDGQTYIERLAASGMDGMPAPDELLARKFPFTGSEQMSAPGASPSPSP